jgi:hypothetical protein
MRKQNRGQIADKAIREIWVSLETHLAWMSARLTKSQKKIGGNFAFHRANVQRYLKIMQAIIDLV